MNDTIPDPRTALLDKSEPVDNQQPTLTVVLESLSGAAAGALVGAVAGPPGAVVGALLGGVTATVAGTLAHDEQVERRAHDRQLDRDIGVTEGDLGAGLVSPPSTGLGAPSLASLGFHDTGRTPAEGPIEDVDD